MSRRQAAAEILGTSEQYLHDIDAIRVWHYLPLSLDTIIQTSFQSYFFVLESFYHHGFE